MKALRIASATALLLATGVSGASAQSAPSYVPVISEPEPARLAEARKLIDILQPPATREQLTKARVDAVFANILKMVREDPTLARTAGDPAIKALTEKHIETMLTMVSDDLGANMPALFEAMARAYARRLSVADLQATEQFFKSPAGQAYIANTNDFMSDPDIAVVQRDMMQRMAARLPAMMAKLKQDVQAAVQAGAKAPVPTS